MFTVPTKFHAHMTVFAKLTSDDPWMTLGDLDPLTNTNLFCPQVLVEDIAFIASVIRVGTLCKVVQGLCQSI